MSAGTITKREKEWRAENDAYTMIEAATIESDAARKRAALSKIKEIAKEREQAAKVAKRVAIKKLPKKKATPKKDGSKGRKK